MSLIGGRNAQAIDRSQKYINLANSHFPSTRRTQLSHVITAHTHHNIGRHYVTSIEGNLRKRSSNSGYLSQTGIMLPTQLALSTLCFVAMHGKTLCFSTGRQGVISNVSSLRRCQRHGSSSIFSMPDDDYPSDYDADDLQSPTKTVAVDIDEDDAAIRDELKRELILLASVTNRGMCASTEESNLVVDLVTQLEVRSYCQGFARKFQRMLNVMTRCHFP